MWKYVILIKLTKIIIEIVCKGKNYERIIQKIIQVNDRYGSQEKRLKIYGIYRK